METGSIIDRNRSSRQRSDELSDGDVSVGCQHKCPGYLQQTSYSLRTLLIKICFELITIGNINS